MGEIVEVSKKGLRIRGGIIPPITIKLAHAETIKTLEAELEEARSDADELVALRSFRKMICPTCPLTLKTMSLFSCAGSIRRGDCKSCKAREEIIHALNPRPRP